MHRNQRDFDEAAGLGIDLIEIERIHSALESRSGKRFELRVFTDQEIAYCRSCSNPFPHFAARFAAKEAAMKALGTGWTAQVIWKGIEVLRDSRGKPLLKFHGTTAAHVSACGYSGALVSLSHDRTKAVAVVFMLRRATDKD